MRWSKVQEHRTTRYADLIEAEAIWGTELNDFFKVVFVMVAISHYHQLIDPMVPESTKEVIRNIDSKRRDIMYGELGKGPDVYKQDMLNAIKPIEEYLKTKLIH